MSIWGFSVDELAEKQKASDEQHRRTEVHNASVVGNVYKVLKLLEESEPHAAQRLALKAKSNFLKQKHVAAARVLDETLGELPKIKFPQSESEQPPRFNVHTGQIATGKVASMIVTVVKAENLPVKDGLTSSCDPFCKLKLMEEGENGRPKCVSEKNTEVKMMTLNPSWNETFQLAVDSIDTTLELVVYDWDEDNTHDFVGKASISLKESISKLMEERDAAFKQNSQLSESLRDVRAVHTYNLGKTYESFWKTGAKSEEGSRRWLPARAELSRLGSAAATAQAHAVSGRPEKLQLTLAHFDGSTTKKLGSIQVILQLVPAPRVAKVSGIQLYPRKGLEIVNALTPSSRLIFTDEEFLESTVVKDATFAQERLLTRDVLWPKSNEGIPLDATKIFRQSLAHRTWRTMTEPARGCPERNHEDEILADALAVAKLARSLGGGRTESVRDLQTRRVLKQAREKVDAARRAWDAGRVQEATAMFEEGVALAREGGSADLEAEGRKLLGDLLLMQGEFRQARQQHMAHVDLATRETSGARSRGGERREESGKEADAGEVLSEEEAARLCREHGVDARQVLGQLVLQGEVVNRAEGLQGVRARELRKVIEDIKTLGDKRYWLERAKTRLERVDWKSGQAQVKMEDVRDTILEMKQERAGQLTPPYVPPQMWGGQAPLD